VPSNELDNEAASTPVDTSISIDEPSVEEVYAAIKHLRNGRAHGPDGIPPELFKCAIHQSLMLYIPCFKCLQDRKNAH